MYAERPIRRTRQSRRTRRTHHRSRGPGGRGTAFSAAFFLIFGLLLTPALPAQERGEPLAEGGGETVEVDLRTVPFYAVDDAGRPVYDLKPEEIRLVVEGKEVEVDTFDRYRLGASAPAEVVPAPGASVSETAGSSTAGSASPEATPRAPQPGPAPEGAPAYDRHLRRHVFLLFDVAFSSRAAMVRSQEAAAALVADLPPSDLLYLVVHHPEQGFRQELGPYHADDAGKGVIVEGIEALKPAPERLQANAESNLPPMHLGSSQGVAGSERDIGPGRNGTPGEQVHNAYEFTGAMARSEYRSIAFQLADSYKVFADALLQVNEPKVVYNFSSGLDDRLYFDGEIAFKGVGSSDAYVADVRRADSMLGRFHPALRALSEAGATMVFANAGGEASWARNSLHHMAEVTGGLVVGGADAASLHERLRGSTSAYYEAGFYTRPGMLRLKSDGEERGMVKVKSLRPGVTLFAPGHLTRRPLYENLDEDQRRFYLVNLVHRGAEGRAGLAGPRMSLHELEGRLVGQTRARADAPSKLVLAASFPAEVQGRELDVYEVVLALPQGNGEQGDEAPEVVRFDRRRETATAEPLLAASEPPTGPRAHIWGLVAVDPSSGDTYFRRLLLQSPLQQAAAREAGSEARTNR